MTTDEMVSIVLDVIVANMETAPADLPEEEIGEWRTKPKGKTYVQIRSRQGVGKPLDAASTRDGQRTRV